MAVHVVNTVLIPRLELGFKFAKPPKATLVSWNNSLAEAMLKVTPGRAAITSSKVAFNIVTGLTHVEDAMVCATIMDVANRLNSRDRMDGRTLWMRLQSAAGKGTSRGAILQAAMQEGGAKVNNRVLQTLKLIQECKLSLTLNDHPWWRSQIVVKTSRQPFHERPARWSPYDPRHTLYSTDEKLEVMAYTDGSTEPGSDSPSGFGIALHEVGRPAGAKDLAGPCRASGNNYLAECVGILGAVQLTPAQADLTVYTDSAAAIWAVKSAAALPNGKRLRMGARPVVHGLARLIQARTGRTTLRHIRSHTGLPDENSRGNERADALAKEGREAALSKPLKWLTQGEEQVIFWSDGKHVVGDIRAEVKRILVRRRLANWSRQSHQGRIAREVGPSILTYCAARRMA